jgi:hypothetical protein
MLRTAKARIKNEDTDHEYEDAPTKRLLQNDAAKHPLILESSTTPL